MKYIVRLGINENYAMQKWNEGIAIVRSMMQTLSGAIAEEIRVTLSFATFVLEGTNGKSCEDAIREAIISQMPEVDGYISLLLFEDDESELAKAMRDIYCMYGFYEYQKMCTELGRMIPLVRDTENISAFRAMNYVVSVDRGFGFSTMVRSFGDFFIKAGLFENMQDNTYDCVLTKDSDTGVNETPDSLNDFLWDSDNEYQVVGIDLKNYIDEEMHNELREFLHRINRLTQKYIFMFRVPVLEPKVYDRIFEVICDVVEAKSIRIDTVNELVLLDYADYEFFLHQCNMSIDASEVFLSRIHKEKMDGRFYGFKTAEKIINEIIWEKIKDVALKKYSGQSYEIKRLTKADISDLIYEEKETKSGFEELSDLIGMEEISKRIEEIVAQIMVAKNNEKMERPCIHMRFAGAPGTGKTTVARIVGKIFREKQILKKGAFFEYGARNLCGEYIGQTAPKTLSICRDAYGSVLFIDEAYALYSGEDGKDYGKEAITTLIAEMENHRDDMVVIMAGYTEDMDKLMESNSGLRSRMPFLIEFKSYTKEQLIQIFMKMITKSFAVEDDLCDAVSKYINSISDSYINSKEFANARFIRNLYERTWAKAALRMAGRNRENIVISKSDFELAASEKEFSEKLMLEKKIGF